MKERSQIDNLNRPTRDQASSAAGFLTFEVADPLRAIVVLEVTKAMRGQIDVASSPNSGSAFWFTIPILKSGDTVTSKPGEIVSLGAEAISPQPTHETVSEAISSRDDTRPG